MLEAYIKEQTLKELESRLPENREEVRAALEAMADDRPFNPHAAQMLAHCFRLDGDLAESKQILEGLLAHGASDVSIKVELAKVLRQQNDLGAAIKVLTEATSARPEFLDNWLLLKDYLQEDGQEEAGKNAMAQFEMIKAFNDHLQTAEKAFFSAEFVRADNICRKLLEKVPGEVRVLRLLARLATEFRHFEISLSILEKCVQVRPSDTALGFDYARALLDCKKFQAALEQCNKLVEWAPEQAHNHGLKAEVLFNLGRYEEAIEIFRELSLNVDKPEAYLVQLGKVLTTVGNTDEAIGCFQRVIATEPGLGQAYWELASLKTYRFSDEEIASMEQVLKTGDLTAINMVLIRFALGKALEDAGQYAESFEHYQAANKGYTKILPYRHHGNNTSLTSFFNAAYFSGNRPSGSDSKAPIFVVGLPRSGSTLVEQIITSHSQVDATGELTGITAISRQLNASSLPGHGQYPKSLADLGADQLRELAQQYLQEAQSFGHGAAYFVDKAPDNFNHIGLIKTLFPGAKIIDVRRNPMASGWSMFRQFFADSFLFSYDLVNIGRYYNEYVDLMDHWQAVLPGQVLTISYEDLVADLPGHVDRMLQYCGLDFEEQCLDFHLNKRAVATPSSEQVRQPIYADALEHWRNYEQFLSPLKQTIRHQDPGK
ncbi:MAG: tetratricopeptide repeat protein [Xanthomonadales bacterium]|nr:tetratricopeptide repeat protein [Xanthomonadales bacterium]